MVAGQPQETLETCVVWWLDSHMKPKGGGWTAKNTSKNTCYHMITCESHDKT